MKRSPRCKVLCVERCFYKGQLYTQGTIVEVPENQIRELPPQFKLKSKLDRRILRVRWPFYWEVTHG